LQVIDYSATGTTYQLSRAGEQGASEAGAEVLFRKVRELAPDEAIASNQGWAAHRLESQHVVEASSDGVLCADAIIFGTPIRSGLVTAQLKQFLDTTANSGHRERWFTRSARRSPAPQRPTAARRRRSLTSIRRSTIGAPLLLDRGYAGPIQFKAGNPYGASFSSNNGALKPDETALAAARFQGKRVAELAAQFVAGREVPELKSTMTVFRKHQYHKRGIEKAYVFGMFPLWAARHSVEAA